MPTIGHSPFIGFAVVARRMHFARYSAVDMRRLSFEQTSTLSPASQDYRDHAPVLGFPVGQRLKHSCPEWSVHRLTERYDKP
jgi:hypothetical protein